MRKSFTALSALAVAGLVVALAGGDTPKANEADIGILTKAVNDYAAALTAGNLPAIAQCWTNDAEFTDATGTTHKGRKAIGDLFAQALENSKGTKYTITIKSARFPAPGIAITEADVVSTLGSESDSGRVSATWVRDNGRWMITSARDLPDDTPASATGPKAVADLQWLIGEWATEDKTNAMKVTARYVLDKHFILFDYAIPQADGTTVTIAQMLGYDPMTEMLASWTFDSRGGNGSGVWERTGNTWTGEVEGIMADGRSGTGTLRIKYLDEKSFMYESANREVDGQPVADASIKFVKTK